jgi:hypothetical protein
MASAQDAHALISYLIKRYREVLGQTLVVSRNKVRWQFDALLMDFSPSEARTLIDYYIEHWDSPNVDWFMYNYDKVEIARIEHDEAEKLQQQRRVETQERLEKWRARWKN